MPWLKLLLSLVLVWLCLRGANAGDVWANLERLHPAAAAAALACLIAHTVLCALRWRLVCRALGMPAPSPRDALRWTALSVTLSQTLPSTVGGDAYRIAALASQRGFAAAARSVIHDRLNGLWMLALLAAGGAATALWLAGWDGGELAAGLAGAAAALALPLLVRVPFPGDEGASFRRLLAQPPLLATSLAIHGMTLAVFALITAGLPGSAAWWQAALVAPAVMLAAALPISLGGWGVREGAMVLFLGLLGVASAEALAISVAYGVLLLVTGALGALAWLAAPRTGANEAL